MQALVTLRSGIEHDLDAKRRMQLVLICFRSPGSLLVHVFPSNFPSLFGEDPVTRARCTLMFFDVI